jgi:hypothetical protein
VGLQLGSDQRGGGGYATSQVCQVFVRRTKTITGIRPGRRRRRRRREPTLSSFCQGLIDAERVRAMCVYVSSV